ASRGACKASRCAARGSSTASGAARAPCSRTATTTTSCARRAKCGTRSATCSTTRGTTAPLCRSHLAPDHGLAPARRDRPHRSRLSRRLEFLARAPHRPDAHLVHARATAPVKQPKELGAQARPPEPPQMVGDALDADAAIGLGGEERGDL